MVKFITIKNEGQESTSNLISVSSIHSLIEVFDDNNGKFIFTQVKLMDGSKVRVKNNITEIHFKITDGAINDVSTLTVWLEEDGSLPNELKEIFS